MTRTADADFITFREFLETPDWYKRAACKGLTATFYAELGDNCVTAKHICRGCPVKTECADHAMATNEKHGLWGGLTPKERLNTKRDLRRECLTCGGDFLPSSGTKPQKTCSESCRYRRQRQLDKARHERRVR